MMVLRHHAAVVVLLAGLATVCANRNTVMSNLDFVPVHKRRLQDLDGETKPESINAKWQCPAVAKEHQDTHNLYHLRGVNLGRCCYKLLQFGLVNMSNAGSCVLYACKCFVRVQKQSAWL
jgi:hypothetical protein